MKERGYNVRSGHKYSLLEIAQKVQIQMKSTNPIIILNKGWNKEYTPDITRLEVETNLPENFISIDEGIALQIAHERKQMG